MPPIQIQTCRKLILYNNKKSESFKWYTVEKSDCIIGHKIPVRFPIYLNKCTLIV